MQRIRRAGFGDGYEQRSADGINAKALAYQLVFRQVRDVKARRVLDFLKAVGGVEAFIWTPPAPHDVKATWVAKVPWDHRIDAYDANTIQVIFEQDFNPALRCEPVVIVDEGGNLVMTTATVGASIRYVVIVSGAVIETPTQSTGTLYSGPFLWVPGMTYIAVAFKADRLDSEPNIYTPGTVVMDSYGLIVTDTAEVVVVA